MGLAADRRPLLRGIAFSVLLAQLWRLQIVEGHSFQQLADINRFRVSPVDAPRGIIYDRNHKIIAANTPSFQVSIVPAGLPEDSNETSRVFLELSTLLGISPVEITERLKRGRVTTSPPWQSSPTWTGRSCSRWRSST